MDWFYLHWMKYLRQLDLSDGRVEKEEYGCYSELHLQYLVLECQWKKRRWNRGLQTTKCSNQLLHRAIH